MTKWLEKIESGKTCRIQSLKKSTNEKETLPDAKRDYILNVHEYVCYVDSCFAKINVPVLKI